MAFYEGYTIEQLNRVLIISKWLLVFFGIVFACVAIINQWLTHRIAVHATNRCIQTRRFVGCLGPGPAERQTSKPDLT